MACPILKSMNRLPATLLITAAVHLLPIHLLRTFQTTHHPHGDHITLAKLLYYHCSSNSLARKGWSDMTRLHMVHELRSWGQLEEGEEENMSDFKLRLKIAGTVLLEERDKDERERVEIVEREKRVEWVEKEKEEGRKREGKRKRKGDDDDDNQNDNEGYESSRKIWCREEDEKVVYTRHYGKRMRF